MDEYVEYITNEGDRWDSVAYKAYGDVSLMSRIIEFNPGVPVYSVLPSGLRLRIPIIEATQTQTSNPNNLPPWKR